jgi:integrase
MAIYLPKYRDKTGALVESSVYWYEFIYAGKRVRESAKTSRRSIATVVEKRRRLELERAYAGLPAEVPIARVRTVQDCTRAYRKAYEQGHRQKSIEWVQERLPHVERALGSVLLVDLTEDRLRGYMAARKAEGAGNRTINMEISILARAIGKPWGVLWPKLKHLEEPKDTGRALTADEEDRLLAAVEEARSPVLAVLVKGLLLTGMRYGEFTGMAWGRVDLENRIMTVGRAKTPTGTGRQIPMNDELFDLMTDHTAWFTEHFGPPLPTHYLFPAGSGWPSDPTQPARDFHVAWGNLRKAAGVSCRIHDLRHTALTKLAESGASDSTIMALAGHLSRAMLERYSHIRMAAKRDAVESLSLRPRPQGIPQGGRLIRQKVTQKR